MPTEKKAFYFPGFRGVNGHLLIRRESVAPTATLCRYCEVCGGPVYLYMNHVCPSMKLWLINRDDAKREEWCGFVIRAETEQEARDIAAAHGHYGRESFRSSKLSTCVEVTAEGEPGVILGFYGD